MIVVDASIGVKWFLDEPGSLEATSLLVEHRRAISAPDLFGIEVASALVRGANVRKRDQMEFRLGLERLSAILLSGAVQSTATDPAALELAGSIAIDIGHPLRDCVYLALAMELDCPLMTADVRFAARAREVYGAVEIVGV